MSPQHDERRLDERTFEATRRQIADLKAEIARLSGPSEPVGDLQRHQETAKRLFASADEILHARGDAADGQEV